MDAPECPHCHCPTLTMPGPTFTLKDGRILHQYSCDACGHGWPVIEPKPQLVGARDVAGFVGGSDY